MADEELVHLGGMAPLHRRNPPPPRRFRFSFPGGRRDGSLSPRGRVRLFPSAQGRAGGDFGSVGKRGRKFGWDRGARRGASRWFKIACGKRWWVSALASAGCRTAADCLAVGVWGWQAGVVSVSGRLKWGTGPADLTRSPPRIGAGGGGSVVAREVKRRSRTGQTERYVRLDYWSWTQRVRVGRFLFLSLFCV